MIKAWLIGDAELVARLDRTPQAMQSALEKSVARLAIQLLANVKTDKLSGQVLNVRTGRLRRSINQKVEMDASKVIGKVGTNVSYAARQEYGFSGTESVRGHLRKITQAFGRPIAEKEVTVNAFTRNVNYPEHSFLRSALNEMKPKIENDMKKALGDAARTGSA